MGWSILHAGAIFTLVPFAHFPISLVLASTPSPQSLGPWVCVPPLRSRRLVTCEVLDGGDCSWVGVGLPEDVDWDRGPGCVLDEKIFGAVCETIKRARNGAA